MNAHSPRIVPGYTILDHPADLGIEALGKTAAEAFEQAALALMSIILDPVASTPRERRTVVVSAPDPEQLLVRWLSEILFLYDGEHFAAREFRIDRMSPTELSALVLGEAFLPESHGTRLDVKAVTYHQLEVRDHGACVTLRVFLDI